jgi:hypothetical protein
MSTLKAALSYATERGWKVFPARFVGKTKKSWKSAKHSNGAKWGMSKDPAEIRDDFTKWPDAVGIPTGAVNGIFVIEVDTKKGHNVDGAASLKALEAKHGSLPETLQAMSPSGSRHRYYKHPGNSIKVWNSASELGHGLDVRGDGGMVVAPPSKRTDGRYRWLNKTGIAAPPAWLLDLVTKRAAKRPKAERAENKLDRACTELAAATEGNRHRLRGRQALHHSRRRERCGGAARARRFSDRAAQCGRCGRHCEQQTAGLVAPAQSRSPGGRRADRAWGAARRLDYVAADAAQTVKKLASGAGFCDFLRKWV